ncbi:MAG TPA: [acyl-carrier-protein] S-malonyltransferase [Planctomycetes bacterium]|nr:[acyl-carrier-protein] S-malonyltransferase [Planctomycetota bacterium]
MKAAGLLFAGQGAQAVGMARDVYERYPAAAAIIDEACSVLGFDLKKAMFEGPADELTATDVSQPAIYVHSYAVFRVLKEGGAFSVAGRSIVGAAGLSLGEYSALAAAGCFDWRDGLRLVRCRGELMQEACAKRPGTMASVLGLEEDACREACEEASGAGIVTVANINSPGQIVISGETPAVEKAAEILRSRGAKRVIALAVAGAFHSPLMVEAADGLKSALNALQFRALDFPVAANVTGRFIDSPEEAKGLLLKQLTGAVRFADCLKTLRAAGADSAVEIGPGKVLAGLARRTIPDIQTLGAGSAQDILSMIGEDAG